MTAKLATAAPRRDGELLASIAVGRIFAFCSELKGPHQAGSSPRANLKAAGDFMKPPREIKFPAEPGEFRATGATADLKKFRGFQDLFLADVAARIAAAERLLIEDKKLIGAERRRFEQHLADLKKNVAAMADIETPNFAETDRLYRSILTLGNFDFRSQDKNARLRTAREGRTRKAMRHDALIIAEWREDKPAATILATVNSKIVAAYKAADDPDHKEPDIIPKARFYKQAARLRAAGKLPPKSK
jgi:hypothetical protein